MQKREGIGNNTPQQPAKRSTLRRFLFWQRTGHWNKQTVAIYRPKILKEFSLWKSSGIFSKRYNYQRQLKNQVFRDFSLWKSVWACFTFWFAITSAKFSYLKFLFIFMVIVLEFFSQEKSSKDTKVKNCGKKMKL